MGDVARPVRAEGVMFDAGVGELAPVFTLDHTEPVISDLAAQDAPASVPLFHLIDVASPAEEVGEYALLIGPNRGRLQRALLARGPSLDAVMQVDVGSGLRLIAVDLRQYIADLMMGDDAGLDDFHRHSDEIVDAGQYYSVIFDRIFPVNAPQKSLIATVDPAAIFIDDIHDLVMIEQLLQSCIAINGVVYHAALHS